MIILFIFEWTFDLIVYAVGFVIIMALALLCGAGLIINRIKNYFKKNK